MSKEMLYRLAGFAGMLGGVLGMVASIIVWFVSRDQPASVAAISSSGYIGVILGLLGHYLILLALVGFYARQVKESGSLGLFSFIAASIGSSLGIGFVWANAFVLPDVAVSAPEFLDAVAASPSGKIAVGIIITFIFISLGWVMAGVAWLRAKVMPPLPVWILIAGAILILVLGVTGLPVGDILFGLAVFWLGFWLSSEKRES